MDNVCVICGKKKDGIAVKIDHVINAIRWFNRNIKHTVRNNRLVVCKECYPEYRTYRSKFVRRRATYVGLAVLFALVGLIFKPSLLSFVFGAAVVMLLYLVSLLSYAPALNTAKQSKQPNKQRQSREDK